MLQFSVSDSLCTRCGQCVLDCPAVIIDLNDGDVPIILPEKEAQCIQCQHCLAICPTAALSILGKDPANSLPSTTEMFPTFDEMSLFVRGRRSIRRYKDENVDPELLNQILASLANCPTGVNRRELTFNVIDDKAVMQYLRTQVLSAIA